MKKKKKMSTTQVIVPKLVVPNPTLETLADVFSRFAKDLGAKPRGDKIHAKVEHNLYFGLEYDDYSSSEEKIKVLDYDDFFSNIHVRDSPSWRCLTYRSLTPYLKQNRTLLTKTKTNLANYLLEGSKDWPQCDEKRTSISKQVSWTSLEEVYKFLKNYAVARLKIS